MIPFRDKKSVAEQLGVSQATLWRMTRDGLFPKPVKISARRVGWPADVVEKAIAEKMGEAA